MGHHQSHESPAAEGGRGLTASASGADLRDQATKFAPIDKLAKVLVKKSHDEDGVNGITERCFTVHLFPKYPELASRLFDYFRVNCRAKARHVPAAPFKLQCEKFLGMLDDKVILETHVRMFSEVGSEDVMKPENLRTLLMTCYKLSMDHHTEGPQTCFMINDTLTAVVNSCFHTKNTLSVNYVTKWLEQHCHRLILPIHRYCVHVLSTAWRLMDLNSSESTGLELATPVLETPPNGSALNSAHLLPVSRAWLLAGSLPSLYSQPHNLNTPNSSGINLASVHFLSRLVCVVPSHWALLYTSIEHGLGANRFLHHVLAYRGPTLILLHGGNIDDQGVAEQLNDKITLCIAAPTEWRESHLYIGGPECALLQLQPKFSILEQAPKMLYLNTSIRGYPKGLRVGTDTRKPIVSIDEGFEKFEYRGILYPLESMEVWGCGDQASRDTQLDIKKWQIKEAERQRQVKLSAADWMDHPDRYLLELAGRPQYNNSSK